MSDEERPTPLMHSYPEDEEALHVLASDVCPCDPVVSLMLPPDGWIVAHGPLREETSDA